MRARDQLRAPRATATRKTLTPSLAALLILASVGACDRTTPAPAPAPASSPAEPDRAPAPAQSSSAAPSATPSPALVAAARAQVGVTVRYDAAYVRIAYPNGDVAPDRGVCTDVVIRALRSRGLDLQRTVHEDMRARFARYPQLWGATATDRNIDHRRVPNLRRWFERQGWERPATAEAADYLAGDIVTWRLSSGVPHIGLVSDRRTRNGRPLVLHNIGNGTREEDRLFAYAITGHYRPSAEYTR